jgi:hypothetical protein
MSQRTPILAAAVLILATAGVSGPAFAQVVPPAGLEGRYQAVAYRPYGDATAERVPSPRPEVSFGRTLRWLDGRNCDNWTVEAPEGAPAPGTADPVLSDVHLPPAGEPGMFPDNRRNQLLRFFCDGALLGELVRVDERVLYAEDPAERRYVVLERPLGREAVATLQKLLNEAGFDAGPADGIMGNRTRAAIGDYARSRGAAFAFETGIASSNLLDGLRFSAGD